MEFEYEKKEFLQEEKKLKPFTELAVYKPKRGKTEEMSIQLMEAEAGHHLRFAEKNFLWKRQLQQEQYDRDKEMATLRNEWRVSSRNHDNEVIEKEFERKKQIDQFEEKKKESAWKRTMKLKELDEIEKDKATARLEKELTFRQDLLERQEKHRINFEKKEHDRKLEEERLKIEKLNLLASIASCSPNTDLSKIIEKL